MTDAWVANLLGGAPPAEGETVELRGRRLRRSHGIVRDLALVAGDQAQTRDAFSFKWGKQETYLSETVRNATRDWLVARYGDFFSLLPRGRSAGPVLLDAGCGSGFSASLLFPEELARTQYVGADISTAIDIAAETIRPRAKSSFFLQVDILNLPFLPGSFDIVYSEGVMHHTPSTHQALKSLARLVRPGGVFAFYVYARKTPVREFTDDFIRDQVANMPPEQAWAALMPLTRLGKALGELNVEVDVPEDVALLGIPRGRIDVQRLFYWYVCKAYHRPDYSLDEMNHVNFDWFTPKYSHRQTPDEVRAWCADVGISIERFKTEEAGITVVAKRPEC